MDGGFEGLDDLVLVGNVVDALWTVLFDPGLDLFRETEGGEGLSV